MKDNGQFDRAALEQMVREVNATQVAPEDKLTDSVYHYDSKEKVFELAEKFEVRAQERDVIKSPEKEETREGEHEEKPSTLAKLKAEKEKIAKQPKKDPVDKHKSNLRKKWRRKRRMCDEWENKEAAYPQYPLCSCRSPLYEFR